MNGPKHRDEQSLARLVTGALGHMAKHMETGCPRAAHLSAMLLERVASDPQADAHLRAHAREMIDILERDHPSPSMADCAASTSPLLPDHAAGFSAARSPS